MSYLRHSFTLPRPLRRFKVDTMEKDCESRTLQRHSTLSKSELTLYTCSSNGSAYYGLDNLEDYYCQEKGLSFPDFYGGHPVPECGAPNDSHSDYESAASESVSLASTTATSTSSGSGKFNSESHETIADGRFATPDEDSGKAQFLSVNKSRETELFSESLLDIRCCCRGYEHSSGGSMYRLNLNCCDQMEPLWECDDNVQFRPRKGTMWLDRKLRHRSCPLFQAHLVAAFEQSLTNMTGRLQHLTASAEQKDSQLGELRNTIDALKKQSAEAGLTKMALQSMQAVQRTMQSKMSRQMSTDSVSSVNSQSSAYSGSSISSDITGSKGKKKKKGWLRSSFSKAFSRSKKNKNGSVSDVEDSRHIQSDSSTPNSPLLGPHPISNGALEQPLISSHSSSVIYEKDKENAPEVVKDLKKQLREKDMILTDIRLEALTSAHQLESLKDTVNKMKAEMVNLKQDNERLQQLVVSKSLNSSQSLEPFRTSLENTEKRISAPEYSNTTNVDMYLTDAAISREGKRVIISTYLCCHGDYHKVTTLPEPPQEVVIGSVLVNGSTKWDLLDNIVKKAFKEYVFRLDPVSSLGLNAESVLSYHIGDVLRSKDVEIPELLPYGYLVGENVQICITLKGTKQNSTDALAVEMLIPKSIVQRYVSLLSEHRRIILCGPSGTRKTHLAQKLAEFLVFRSGKELSPGAIATFSVDHKSAKELQQYLFNIAEQCESSNSSDLPTVIILDNLHHVGSLGEVFNGFLCVKYQNSPYIIGTMNQTTCSTTNLQLHHNFRWVLCANHMEPVKGFLGRFLRRKLVETEVTSGIQNPDLVKIIDWVPKVWIHLNTFLETHSSSDVTIGPRLFLSCPIDVSGSQVWFIDLWNYSIIPYIMEAVREGLQLYGRRAPWEDPTEWVQESYPWPSIGEPDWPQLLHLRPEDVGYESHPVSSVGTKTTTVLCSDLEADPLLNMLMRLQEAASYSSPNNNDTDDMNVDNVGIRTKDLLNTELESTL